MKRVLLLILALIAANLSYAQEEQNKTGFVLGGSLNLSNSNNERTSNTFSATPISQIIVNKNLSASINPYLGKSLNPKSLIGFGIYAGHSIREYTFSAGSSESFSQTTNTDLGLNVFYRYYPIQGNKIKFFLQPYASFRTSFGKIEQLAPALDETKGNIYLTGIDYGATYSFSPKWHFLIQIAGLNYQYSKSRKASQDESVTNGSFNLTSSLSNIRIGIERKF